MPRRGPVRPRDQLDGVEGRRRAGRVRWRVVRGRALAGRRRVRLPERRARGEPPRPAGAGPPRHRRHLRDDLEDPRVPGSTGSGASVRLRGVPRSDAAGDEAAQRPALPVPLPRLRHGAALPHGVGGLRLLLDCDGDAREVSAPLHGVSTQVLDRDHPHSLQLTALRHIQQSGHDLRRGRRQRRDRHPGARRHGPALAPPRPALRARLLGGRGRGLRRGPGHHLGRGAAGVCAPGLTRQRRPRAGPGPHGLRLPSELHLGVLPLHQGSAAGPAAQAAIVRR
mmetsp:Transcript_36533/g.97849  ORF Transcript_36533/g.97849 Transcript_36533/m.97849 type:complete len:281 (-) Transcript_36533:585-1427(-)